MKEEIELYLRRAEKFEANAQFNFDRKDYDLAMFHIEQAMQLLIKARLLNEKGYFERTHGLRRLLSEFQDKEGVREFVEKYKKVLRNLERAYVSSRYYFEEFFEDEVVEAFKALEELRSLLWKD
ncbi:MAG: HEPN domain-containing protein [Archaeoglobaceae archaeon]|nr:HEPN domain-containing protein [Archaeoglobaceae archaeon]MDW8118025.1 HEPN domain-containing protein [Archaeoglobaceae archaeon]